MSQKNPTTGFKFSSELHTYSLIISKKSKEGIGDDGQMESWNITFYSSE